MTPPTSGPLKRRPLARFLRRYRYLPAVVGGAAIIALAGPPRWWSLVGAAAVVAGAALRLWAAGYGLPTAAAPAPIPAAGPYGWVRNPRALGAVAIGVGLAAWGGGWEPWLSLAVGAGLVWQGTLRARLADEEKERLLGWEYRAYRAVVPLWVPRLTRLPGGAPSRWRPGAALRGEWPVLAFVAAVGVGAAAWAFAGPQLG
jgi:protein-S-isoprenylcysteine O-methyltransferase Ste14